MTTPCRIVCFCALMTLACANAIEVETPKTPPPVPAVAWYSDVAQAFADARERKLPLLLLIELPGQSFSRQLLEKFSEPEIAEAVKGFIPVRVNIEGGARVVEQLSIRILPDLRVFDPEGTQLGHVDGSQETAALAEFLKTSAKAKPVAGAPTLAALFPTTELDEFEKLASAGKLPDAAKLTRLIKLAGDPPGESHTEAQRLLKAWAPQLAAQLPAFLSAEKLKTRLAAYDALCDIDAPLSGYDPWNEPAAQTLVATLNTWAAPVAAAAATHSKIKGLRVLPALTGRARAQVEADLQDLRRGGDRRTAAQQRLIAAGREIVPSLREFARSVSANDPELALLCDEIRFRLLLDSETLRKKPAAPHILAAANSGERAALLGAILGAGGNDLEALAQEAMCDREPLFREVGVHNLSTVIADPNEYLREALKDADANVRVAALTAMAEKGSQDDEPAPVEKPRSFLDWIKGAPDKAAEPPAKTPLTNAQAIAEYLRKEPDADMIGHAVRALGSVDSNTSRKALRNLLHDVRWQVRAEAVDSLAKLNDQASASEFAKLAVGDDGYVAGKAVTALTKMEPKTVDPETMEKAVAKHPEVTLTVIKALSDYEYRGNQHVDKLLRKFTKLDKPEIRAQALLALASDSNRSAFEEVSAGLNDPAPVVRAAAAQSLRELVKEKEATSFIDGTDKPPSAYQEIKPKLTALMKDPDEAVHSQTLRTLLYFGDWQICWPEVPKSLANPHDSQRTEAAALLRYLPGDRVLEAVRGCLNDTKTTRSSDEWLALAHSAVGSLHSKAAKWPKDPLALQATFEILPHIKTESLPAFLQEMYSSALQSHYYFEYEKDDKNDVALAAVLHGWIEKTQDPERRRILKLGWLRCARLDENALKPLTEDKDFETRRMALAITLRRENKGSPEIVKRLIADQNADLRCMGVVAAIPRGWREPLTSDPLMHDIIAGEHVRLYMNHSGSTDFNKQPKVVELPVETLEKLLKDPDQPVRVATAYLMSLEGGDQGLAELAQHLKTSDRKEQAATMLLRATILAWDDEHTHYVADALNVLTADKNHSYYLRPFQAPLKALKGEQIKKLRAQLKINWQD